MHDDPTSHHDRSESEQVIDSIVDEFVEQALGGRVPDIDAACARYPEFADRIRQAAASLKLLADQNSHLDGKVDSTSLRDHFSSALGRSAQNVKDRTVASSSFKVAEKELNFGGKYRLREELGEGGFGVVYVAEQLKPVRRKVAIKVLKPGMDSKEVLARFDAERQALAMMDHPNVAKVLDGGMSEDGRPYFVMELIRGIPITAFCNSQKLSILERLEIFRDTCLAVQHAHIKGIIHRDIKPSNVLVTMRDDTPVAKVIDFGVAKALHNQLTDATVYTAFGQMIGTPIYMSPEQIQLSEQDVDTRSDIYSLGVLLYELITGNTPFTRQALMEKGIQQFREMVCDTPPPRPSHHLSTVRASDDPTVVDQRRYESHEMKRISGELDWIVMRSLEKNRSRRYQSCAEFAKDIDNFLTGDAVNAKPPTLWYRTSKLIKQNQGLFLATTAVVAALLLGLWTTYQQKKRAERAEKEATASLKESIRQTELAENRLELAETAVDDMYIDVANKWIQSQAGMTEKQREFLEKAAEIYRQLAGAIQLKSSAQKVKYARTLGRVAAVEIKLGELEQSTKTATRGARLLKELHDGDPTDVDITLLLAESYYTLGRTFRSLGERQSSWEWFDKAIDLLLSQNFDNSTIEQREQLTRHANNATTVTVSSRSRIDVTRELIDLSETVGIELLEADRDNAKYTERRARAIMNRAVSYLWWGQENEEAAASFQRAISMIKDLRDEDPENVNHLRDLQTCLQNLSVVLNRLGRQDETVAVKHECLEVSRELAAAVPDQWQVQDGLRRALRSLALEYKRNGGLEKARQNFEESFKVAKSMSQTFPEVIEAHSAKLAALRDLASLELEYQDYPRATEYFSQLLENSAISFTRFPDSPQPLAFELIARSFGSWTSAKSEQDAQLLKFLAPMVARVNTYDRSYEQSREDPIIGFLNVVRFCELALAAVQDAHVRVSASDPSSKLAKELSKIEAQLSQHAANIAEMSCKQIRESEKPFARILEFSESYEPPPEYVFTDNDAPGYSDLLNLGHVRGWNRVFQSFAKSIADGTLDSKELHPGHLFVLCSAPGWVERGTLDSLVESMGALTQAEKQAKAWCLYRLGEYAECADLLDDEMLASDHANDYVAALVAFELGETARAAELLAEGSQWLDANEKDIRAQRDAEGAHLQPHLFALKRLRYEAEAHIKGEASK
ncbi:MAG: hypothetical protein Aurels2KO_54160 [Aureliella sp.]